MAIGPHENGERFGVKCGRFVVADALDPQRHAPRGSGLLECAGGKTTKIDEHRSIAEQIERGFFTA